MLFTLEGIAMNADELRIYNESNYILHIRDLYPDEAQALWYAVFERAVDDLLDDYERTPAARWFISNSIEIGSFIWICEQLDIDPQVVRKILSCRIYFMFN